MVADRFDMVFTESLKVKLRNFHNNVKCDEMNDSDFNFGLESEQPAVDSLAIDGG